jgi:hypothetical protein
MTELVLKFSVDSTGARGITAPDGNEVFSVYDILSKAYTNKDPAGTARKEFQRLISDGSPIKDEILSSCYYIKFPGQGQRETPCFTIRGLQRLFLMMKGKVAEDFRKMVEGVFSRVVGGDTSLIQTIEANAASDAPLHQMYRRALAQEPVAPAALVVDESVRKRQLDRDEDLFQLELAERKQRLVMLASEAQTKAAEAQMKVVGVQKMLMESYSFLCPNQAMDDRAKLLFKDNLLNIATQSTPSRLSGSMMLAIEGGGSSVVHNIKNLNKPITISTLAAELGYRFDSGQLQSIGKRVANAFREKYGESPGKHEQLVGQASIMVNSYTERDRGLIEKVLVDFKH